MQTSALKSKLSVMPERKETLEGFKLCRMRRVTLGGRLFFREVWKAPYPCTKEEREAKEALMAREMLRTRFLPSLSARPPRTKAPPIIPR